MELFLEGEESFLLECGREEQGDVGALSPVCNRGEGGDEYTPFPLSMHGKRIQG